MRRHSRLAPQEIVIGVPAHRSLTGLSLLPLRLKRISDFRKGGKERKHIQSGGGGTGACSVVSVFAARF